MRRRFALLFLIAVGLALPASARAAMPILNVDIGRGVAVTLSSPAASVFIADPGTADVQVMSPTELMVFGKTTGTTTLMATDNQGHILLARTVLVAQDLAALRHELSNAIPGNDIRAASVPNGIVLTGTAHDPASVEDAQKIATRYLGKDGQIINRIQLAGSNQVMLRVRFAEVSRSVDNSFGIDWSSAASFGGIVFGIASGAGIAFNSAGALIRPNNSTLATSNDVLQFSHHGGRTNLNNLIDALAQDGLATILAEPNLTAMSGQTASFLAGGEFPIPVPQGGTSNQITVQFKDYGVSLEFTPTIIGDNRINLHVKPEVSELTTTGSITLDNIAIPALTTRKAETTVELASGQSFAIAGLLDNNQSQTVNKFPVLGDLPILGPLFRSSQFQNNQSELVIIVTPYIVKPAMNANQMALPTDGYAPPSETDRLLRMRYSASDPNARPVSGEPLAAPVAPVTPAAPASVAPTAAGAQPAPIEALKPDALPPSDNSPSIVAPSRNNLAPAPAPMPMPAPGPVSGPAAPRSAIHPAPISDSPAPAGSGGFIVE